MAYTEVSELVSTIMVVSVATERVVEIVKPMLPKFDTKYSTAVYSTLALTASTLILGINDVNVSMFHSNTWIQAGVIGLACTAGSGVWSDVLKIIQNMKIKPAA